MNSETETKFINRLIYSCSAILLLGSILFVIALSGCSMTFQNVNARGDVTDLSDETTQPTTDIPLTTRIYYG